MKRLGYKWHKRAWWESWRFNPFLVRVGYVVPVYHSDHEQARGALTVALVREMGKNT